MKKLEFETSKGEFVLVDGVGEDFAMDLTHMIVCDEWFINLSDIPEEKASDVVESATCFHSSEKGYINYMNNVALFNSAIESLHSLLKSKGIHLFENPYENELDGTANDKYVAEDYTFYNPYLFRVKN